MRLSYYIHAEYGKKLASHMEIIVVIIYVLCKQKTLINQPHPKQQLSSDLGQKALNVTDNLCERGPQN